MIEAVLKFLFKVREIPHPEGGIYLRRFYVTPRWFPWINVFVHKLYTPDPDRALHDHPWDFWTFPLSGYWEINPDNLNFSGIFVAPRCWHYRPAEYIHRIISLHGVPTWTIVITHKARREWGFWVEGEWVRWRDYLDLPGESQPWEDVVR